MALPNPSMSFSPFAILTAEELNDIVENIESLADGTGFNSGAIPTDALADKAVTSDKIDFATLPYGRIYYSTVGSGGGQTFGAGTYVMMNFNTLDSDSRNVSSPTTGQLQVDTTGSYKISVHARCQEVGQSNQMVSIEASFDGGSTWIELAPRGVLFSTDVARGPQASTIAHLPAGTRVRAMYNNAGGSITRVAAGNAGQQKYAASLVVAM